MGGPDMGGLILYGACNGEPGIVRNVPNPAQNICSEDDLRYRIFGAFVVKFLTCPPLLGFSNIYKMI